ncbi:hypothetical protein NCS56_00262500 [Fusarium sp. Ph1]|nr:hypothetical protein NCS56_00262500 [Fusarium sp. Ph1]
MVECENNAYEKSILKNMQETCSQLRSLPRPPAEQVEGTPDTNSLRQFAWFRGTRRAALQQCLSQFSNAENAAEARDPFSYTLAHKWFTTAEQWWGAWMRPHSVKESYGQRLWLHRKEAIMELPHNFKGPYVVDYFDKDMRKTQELLNKCQIIWDRLDDKEKYFNRELLTKIVRSGRRRGDFPILGAHGRLFEERVDEMLNDISRDSFFHPTAGPKSQDFMEVLNRDCDGPMKRYRFSRKERLSDMHFALKKKGKIYAAQHGNLVRGPVKTKAKDDDGVTISQPTSRPEVTEPESVDLGPYAKGLPKLANIRSWDETILDRQAVSTDMEKTLVLFEGLGYRLGRTLRDLRKQHAKDLRESHSRAKESEQQIRPGHLRLVGGGDYPLRANDPRWNPNMVDDSWENRVTPKFCDTIKMAEPEAYQESWDRERGFRDVH